MYDGLEVVDDLLSGVNFRTSSFVNRILNLLDYFFY